MEILDLTYDCFGLDINDSSLKIIKLEKKQGKFSIASFGHSEIKAGVVESGIIKNEKELAQAIRSACNSVKGKKLKTKYAVISLPEEKSFLQVIQMPKMSRGELKSAIVFEAENYIPLPIEQVYLDFQAIAPLEDGLDHIDVLIAATPKKIVDSYVSCVESAGLIPLSAEIKSQSIVRALVKNETSEDPLAIIDVGGDNIDFIVFSGNSIRFTYSMVGNMAMEDLGVQIKKYIDFYQEHSREHFFSKGEIKKNVLSGGEANLKKLPEFIAKKIAIQTEIGNPFINLPPLKSEAGNAGFLAFAAALGLALKGINIEKDDLS